MNPVISVVVPVYNEEKRLPNALLALNHQNFKLPYEIIVVNNNSTDKTLEIAKEFGARVVSEKNKGVIFAKQKGLLSARAEIVAVCDADCKPSKNWLRTIYRSLQSSEIVGVGGIIRLYDGPNWHKIYNKIGFSLAERISKTFDEAIYVNGGNVAFKKRALLKFGGYDTRLSMGEDELGILGKLKKTGKVIFNSKMINYSSGRRARVGFFRFFLYELPLKYCLNYFLSSIFKRQFLPPFSDIR